MRVFKPQLLSLLYRPFLLPSRPQLSVTTLVAFSLREEHPLVPEVDLWRVIGQEVKEGFDEGFPKVRGEVLVFGSCYVPGGEARPVCPVRVQIGPIDKRLAVIGDRIWNKGVFTKPQPFVEMPLTWERAFGGPSSKKNPKGRGMAEDRGDPLLPNIETPGSLVTSPRSRPEPAGFGPIDVSWIQRASKAGTYSGPYLEKYFPGFAPDVGAEFFQLAPSDQWMSGYFGGNEEYVIENMSPERPIIRGQLPDVQARNFIQRRGSTRFEEWPCRLDTVVFFPGRDLGVLVFRSTGRVDEYDGTDIGAILAGCEERSNSRSSEHYQAAADRRSSPDENVSASLNEDDLIPAFAAGTGVAASIEAALNEPTPEAKDHRARVLEAVRERLVSEGINPGPMLMASTDLPQTLESLEASMAEAEEQARSRLRGDLATQLRELQTGTQVAGGAVPDGLSEVPPRRGPPAGIADTLLGSLAGTGIDAQAVDVLGDKLRAADEEIRKAYRQAAHRMPPVVRAGAGASEPVRAEIRARLSKSRNFAGEDWTGLDLSGLELPGADLRGALLEGATLAGSDLSHVNLDDAVLAHSDIRGSSFAESQGERVNFGKARLEDVQLAGAKFREAIFEQAELISASFKGADLTDVSWLEASFGQVDFERAKLPGALFQKALLTGCRFPGAQLTKANILQSCLDGVDLSHADLELVTLLEVRAARASFVGARLCQLHAVMNCSFKEANFAGANLTGAFLRGADFENADFSDACLKGADLSECNLRNARFSRTDGREALLVKADLSGATIQGANFMQAMLPKATLFEAQVSNSNFFGANLGQIKLNGSTRFSGCNLKRVLIHPKAVASTTT